jgi:uncharacterized protein (DUF433 family)
MAVQLDMMLEQSPDICGGRLHIAGTRITVHQIAALHKQGHTAQYIVENTPYLTIAQVYAALAYYHANREAVDAELVEEDREYERLKEELGTADGP